MWYVFFLPLGTPASADDGVQLVSQFTLYAKMKKGNKPDFHDAASPDTARKIYDFFYKKMGEGYAPDRIKNGVFQAMMDVELKNDGPVGVDYCSEDAAVHLPSWLLSSPLLKSY
jgi:D-tyrosyl-tRNA(Tyr) deacylase